MKELIGKTLEERLRWIESTTDDPNLRTIARELMDADAARLYEEFALGWETGRIYGESVGLQIAWWWAVAAHLAQDSGEGDG